ncbi:hypothetical protein QQ045_031902 [Rhodiola kirilowii]
MAGTVGHGGGVSTEGNSSMQRCESGEALTEWRSSEQLENGTPSTSPPYWDSDNEDESGLRPSDLYGKYTWKIDKFPQINKRELRSNVFEVGGYKWYIIIYPQGWSHFAQFTISVVNKDPKKSKYSVSSYKKDSTEALQLVETPAPIIRVEKDMFVLVDDVLPLLERVAMEP